MRWRGCKEAKSSLVPGYGDSMTASLWWWLTRGNNETVTRMASSRQAFAVMVHMAESANGNGKSYGNAGAATERLQGSVRQGFGNDGVSYPRQGSGITPSWEQWDSTAGNELQAAAAVQQFSPFPGEVACSNNSSQTTLAQGVTRFGELSPSGVEAKVWYSNSTLWLGFEFRRQHLRRWWLLSRGSFRV